MEVTGFLLRKDETNQVSERFKKRDFVLTLGHDTPYPQHVTFQLMQDKCDLIEQIPLGVEVNVHFNLKGREWTSPQGEVKYFNTIEAWRVVMTQTTTRMETGPKTEGKGANQGGDDNLPIYTSTSVDDDLPF